MVRGVAGTILYFAFDRTTGLGVTGDAANHTLRLSKNGGANAALTTPLPVQLDATYSPGWYRASISVAEATASDLFLSGVSSTPSVLIDSVRVAMIGEIAAGQSTDANIVSVNGGTDAAEGLATLSQQYYDDSGVTVSAIAAGAITDAALGWGVAEVAGVPTTVLGRLRRFTNRWFQRRTKNRTTKVEIQYAADGTTPLHRLTTTTTTASGVTTDSVVAEAIP